jgi:hypothetical protein
MLRPGPLTRPSLASPPVSAMPHISIQYRHAAGSIWTTFSVIKVFRARFRTVIMCRQDHKYLLTYRNTCSAGICILTARNGQCSLLPAVVTALGQPIGDDAVIWMFAACRQVASPSGPAGGRVHAGVSRRFSAPRHGDPPSPCHRRPRSPPRTPASGLARRGRRRWPCSLRRRAGHGADPCHFAGV